MTGLNTVHLAETMAAQRAADTAERTRLANLMAEAGVDHPVRRRFSMGLIHLGLRLSPQPLEIAPVRRSAPDC